MKDKESRQRICVFTVHIHIYWCFALRQTKRSVELTLRRHLILMNEKRSRQQLSPSSPDINSQSKKQHCANMPADMSINQLYEFLTQKFEGLEQQFDSKIENLATKQDLKQYADEVQALKQSNQNIEATLTEMKEERDQFRRKIEQMDRIMRNKNIVIKGLKFNGNINNAVKEFLATKMQISANIEIDSVQRIANKNNDESTVLVKFSKEEHVHLVFANIKKLAGSNVSIDRDYSIETRRQMQMLLGARRIIKSKLVDRCDKSIKVKVIGNRMFINGQHFFINEGQLRCEGEMGFVKLNLIFKAKFDKDSFTTFDRNGMGH